MRAFVRWGGAAWLAVAIGCAASDAVEGAGGEAAGACVDGAHRCSGLEYDRCEGGAWKLEATCDPGSSCNAASGCGSCDGGACLCAPGQARCDGNDIVKCGDDGAWTKSDTCDAAAGKVCRAAACVDLCASAAAAQSYVGCEYFPTTTPNKQLTCGHFAVVVSNAEDVAAAITVDRGSAMIAEATVPAGSVKVIELPWVADLVWNSNWSSTTSTQLTAGAYHLTSNVPITAYQFNPLEFKADGCQQGFTFTNDASLLLPAPALTAKYRVIAWPTWSITAAPEPPNPQCGGACPPPDPFISPGFFSVVGTADATDVSITFSANAYGVDGGPGIVAGEQRTFHLGQGDVLQFFSQYTEGTCAPVDVDDPNGDATSCIGDTTSDFTGTLVEATHPVAVFGGSDCAFVPYDRMACDHLEEQMLPLETWSTSVLMVATPPQNAGDPNLAKVVSGADGNTITFDPAVHAPVTLDAGQSIAFEFEGGFRATGTGRLAVAQFMVGQDYDAGHAALLGDPSMGMGIPPEQFRSSYDFLTPDTYTESDVLVIAPLGASVVLDGKAIPALAAIGATGFGSAAVKIDPGAHHIATPDNGVTFGITVVGFAPYTSYLFPGGLDLKPIEPK